MLTAFGLLDFGRTVWKQTGVIRDERTNSDLFFVTLEKSEREYSPSTLYKDYAISPTLFHWESQSTTRADSPTGRRYQTHRLNGASQALLFVRKAQKDGRGETAAYRFLGPAEYVRHEGERPMEIVWRLGCAMAGEVFREVRLVA